MRLVISAARWIFKLYHIRLHVQHGRERGNRHHTEFSLVLVLGTTIPESWQVMGGMARSYRGLDYSGDEFGVVRLSALVGYG